MDSGGRAVDSGGRAVDSGGRAVAASDAFFPFPDGLETVVEAGATAVIQPGGSVRDAEVVAAADHRRDDDLRVLAQQESW